MWIKEDLNLDLDMYRWIVFFFFKYFSLVCLDLSVKGHLNIFFILWDTEAFFYFLCKIEDQNKIRWKHLNTWEGVFNYILIWHGGVLSKFFPKTDCIYGRFFLLLVLSKIYISTRGHFTPALKFFATFWCWLPNRRQR